MSGEEFVRGTGRAVGGGDAYRLGNSNWSSVRGGCVLEGVAVGVNGNCSVVKVKLVGGREWSELRLWVLLVVR